MTAKEIWKPIEETDGLYQISNLGRVKSMSRFHKTKDAGYYSKEKILKPTMDNLGYLRISLRKPNGFNTRNGYKTFRVHLLVAKAFIENEYNLPVVNHKDGNKQNNCMDNLEWCTYRDNILHAFKTGLNDSKKHKPKKYKRKCELAREYIKKYQTKNGFLNLNEWQVRDLLKLLEEE